MCPYKLQAEGNINSAAQGDAEGLVFASVCETCGEPDDPTIGSAQPVQFVSMICNERHLTDIHVRKAVYSPTAAVQSSTRSPIFRGTAISRTKYCW